MEAVGDDALLVPVIAGATRPGTETLAGASMASFGTVVPSGRLVVGADRDCPAEAVVTPTPARLAVQATDSSARGTNAVAF